jgi:glycosyltransferase involved in cell wall biosynthesis
MNQPPDKNPQRLSVVLMVKNEAANLPRALRSVAFADEIIVADTGSTDETVQIARELGAKVISCAWSGFGPTKAQALAQAAGAWVLSLDADEELTPELAAKIRDVVTGVDQEHAAFRINRQSNFLGRWLRHSGWFPDYVTRLYRRGQARMSDQAVHEKIIPDGTVGTLSGLLLHYTDPTVGHYLDKMKLYARLSAEELFASGRRCRWSDLVLRPPFMLLKTYVFKCGFLDGWQGFVLAVFSAVHVFSKYAWLKSLSAEHDK